jgi:hypothetical protein
MKAIAKVAFKGVRDGEIKPSWIAEGEELTGDLAAVALTQGLAKRMVSEAPANKAVEAAPENRFRAGGMEGRDGSDTGQRAEPKRPAAKGRKARSTKG